MGMLRPCQAKELPDYQEHDIVLFSFRPPSNIFAIASSLLSLLFEMETSQLPCVVLGLKNGFQGQVTSRFNGQGSASPDSPSPP